MVGSEKDQPLLLIVDDDPTIRLLMRESLERAQFSVAEAHDGAEAIERFKELRPDLVLLDLLMPRVDGFSSLAALRQLPTGRRVPIVVVSALEDFKSIQRAYKAGATDFVTKPVLWHLLANRVRFILRASQALERLRASEAKLREAQRLARLANWDWDLDSNEFWWSADAAQMLNLEPRDGPWTYDDYSGLTHPDDRVMVEEALRNTLETRCPYGLDHRTVMADHTTRTFHVQGQVTQSRSGRTNWLAGTIQDITERKQIEEEHQRLQDELHQAYKLEAVGHLAAGIAHEINTPIQFIGDNTRFLQRSFSDVEVLLHMCVRLASAAQGDALHPQLVDEVCAEIKRADLDFLLQEIPIALKQSLTGVDRVARVVRAMREFSHPAEDWIAVDINRAIESTITVARNEWKHVAEMVTDLDPELPPLMCLPRDLNQAILNILNNAAHAVGEVVGDGTESKGTITVSTRATNGWAEIRISDTGKGVPEEIRRNIFDPFFTTKDVGKGSGQGLSIAHTVIVKTHGGTIDLETEVNKGACFVIRLPLDGEVAAAKAGTA